MARFIVKNGHKITHVTMRLDYMLKRHVLKNVSYLGLRVSFQVGR